MTTTTTPAAFTGFEQKDFDTFLINGLEQRMSAIEERIRPKFRYLGEKLAGDIAVQASDEMFLHIAKHARRTVNPPKDTWFAICNNKRGYKAHPHFQLGLFDDHLFLWFALIYEAPNKSRIATTYLEHLDEVIAAVPSDYVLSLDHMKKESKSVSEMSDLDWTNALTRLRDVQKAELLIGRHIPTGDPLLQDGDALYKFAQQTYEALMPLYRLASQ
ncbi:DUF1054 domain-containing protein [Paenibacillus sp. YAF4_2]|uniref:DUF1054 domain-containing protein n=1 Tax=Paenibacillus sp. YAF4_2 TaxID=3233085 RepID=UPI003F95F942